MEGGKEVDQTGLRLWVSEEYLAKFVHSEYIETNKFKSGVKILEVGAGSFGLVGLLCHKHFQKSSFIRSSLVHITDGNEKCIPKLETNIVLNSFVDFRKNSLKVREHKHLANNSPKTRKKTQF